MGVLEWAMVGAVLCVVMAIAWFVFIKPTREGTVDKDPESQ